MIVNVRKEYKSEPYRQWNETGVATVKLEIEVTGVGRDQASALKQADQELKFALENVLQNPVFNKTNE